MKRITVESLERCCKLLYDHARSEEPKKYVQEWDLYVSTHKDRDAVAEWRKGTQDMIEALFPLIEMEDGAKE